MSASKKDRACPHCGEEKSEKHFVFDTYMRFNALEGALERVTVVHPCVYKYQQQNGFEAIEKNEQY